MSCSDGTRGAASLPRSVANCCVWYRDKAYIESLVPEVVENIQGRQVTVEGEGEEEDEKPNK